VAFHVGQKVVCVAVPQRGVYPDVLPEIGVIYTIRDVFDHIAGTFVRVHEIKNPVRLYEDIGMAECRFTTLAFRPVVERKTSIKVFEEILNREKVDA